MSSTGMADTSGRGEGGVATAEALRGTPATVAVCADAHATSRVASHAATKRPRPSEGGPAAHGNETTTAGAVGDAAGCGADTGAVHASHKRQRTSSGAGAGAAGAGVDAGAGAGTAGDAGGTGGAQPTCGTTLLEAAHYGHRGTRRTMEDEHVIMFNDDIRARYPGILPGPQLALFGVFDGHGGKNIATFVKDHLPSNIFAALQACTKKKFTSSFVKKALTQAFAKTDTESQAAAAEHGWSDGTCAVCALVVGERVYIANLGDSKAVLCLRTPAGGGSGAAADGAGASGDGIAERSCPHAFHTYACACKAVDPAIAKPLTQDHKPILVEERKRIEACGGRVENGRVNGMLEVARTFGDRALKRYGVVAEPDLRVHFKVTPHCEFLVLACDGMWTRHSEASCIAKCRSGILAARDHAPCSRTDCVQPEHGWTLQSVAQWVIKDVVHNMGCQDNVTLLLVRFGTGATGS